MEFPAANAGRFGAIVVDPPWRFQTYTDAPNRRAPPYPVMTLQEIKELPIATLARRDGCHLFLWTTGPMLPHAIDVIQAWRFRYSGIAFTWVKLRRRKADALIYDEDDFHFGTGYTTRKNAELCLLARRGNARRNARDVRELIVSPVRAHSRKPDESYARIRRYCDGPYLDLFGRESRPGWEVLGDEPTKFDSQSNLIKWENQDAKKGEEDSMVHVLPY